jgi:hypothetical protein
MLESVKRLVDSKTGRNPDKYARKDIKVQIRCKCSDKESLNVTNRRRR